jgi:hypothetical protein
MASYDYIDKGSDTGTVLGQATTSKIGFFGITPVVQVSSTAFATALTTLSYTSATAISTAIAIMEATATGYGFVNLTEGMCTLAVVQNLQTIVAQMETELARVGIIAGGTAVAATDTQYDIVGSGGGSDGSILGQTSAKLVGFWGIDPVNQPDALGTAVVEITITATASDLTSTITILVTGITCYGFVTAEEAATVVQAVSTLQTIVAQMRTRLIEAGVIGGGTGLTSAIGLDFIDKGNGDGTILGRDSTAKIGLWGVTPVVQPSALTTALTTITITATVATEASADFAIQTLVTASVAFKFTSAIEAKSFLAVVKNLQVRVGEIEAALEGVGFVTAN